MNKVSTNLGFIKARNKQTANEKKASKEIRNSTNFPLDVNCPTNYVIYNCTASTTVHPD